MTNPLIYEVNLKVAEQILEPYLLWLQDHIKVILQEPGFLKAHVYEEGQNKGSFVVQYHVENSQALERYLQDTAPRMRQEAIDLFGDKFQATRRVLMML
jgi:quinol monooxygenase YgiN